MASGVKIAARRIPIGAHGLPHLATLENRCYGKRNADDGESTRPGYTRNSVAKIE